MFRICLLCYAKNRISIPRTTSQQYYNAGTWISGSNLKQEIWYFTTYKPVFSCRIYIGNNQFIRASSGSGKIIISSMSNSHYAQGLSELKSNIIKNIVIKLYNIKCYLDYRAHFSVQGNVPGYYK